MLAQEQCDCCKFKASVQMLVITGTPDQKGS